MGRKNDSPVERIALELHAKEENKWFRRKSFLFFLKLYNTYPTTLKQRAQQQVLAVMPELQRLIVSFL